jgi:hypothetical protein
MNEDYNSELICLEYSYTSQYQMRENETFGMGKETVRITGAGTVKQFLHNIAANSNLKHEDGNPSHKIFDIKYRYLNEQEAKLARRFHADFLWKHQNLDEYEWIKTGYTIEEFKQKFVTPFLRGC